MRISTRKVAKWLSLIGPGLFLIGYNIGTGSVTTMAKAGAEYGMSLFWALVLSCVFTFVLMVAYGQLTLVTGHTALYNFKTQFRWGRWLSMYIIVALVVGELLSLMGIMGIVSDLLQEGVRIVTGGFSVSTFWITLVLSVLLYLLLWYGRYQVFEKVLTVFVILMGLSFILVFFMVKPSLAAIAKGLVPRVPNVPGAPRLIAAMAGTTCSAAVFVIRSTVVAEKGWGPENLKDEKRDALVSASMMLFLSGVIMAVAAGTLHLMGLRVNETLDMIHLFEPIGGVVAALILIVGITAAGISTVFPIVLIAPWLICDYTGRPRDIHSPLFRWLGLFGMLFAFGSQVLSQKPPILMVFSQAFQATILPAVVIPVFILINRKRFVNGHTANRAMNVGLAAVLIFALYTTYLALVDMF